MDNNNFFNSLTKSLLNDVRKVMEAKAHTIPKTDKEKKLAAIAEPKDKITHADVLKGRGVTREGVEQVEEMSSKMKMKLGLYGKKKMKKEEVHLTAEEIAVIEAKMAGIADGAMEGEKHMCATKVFHKEWAEGMPIKTMHADPDANGLIEWYDVMFDHGIERVMTEDMEILQQESHMHSKKKMKEEVDIEEAMSAPDRYTTTHAATKNLLKSINDHLAIHKDVATKHKNSYSGTKGPTWGHVGDLDNIHNQLKDIHDRLASQGEYAISMREGVDLEEAKRGRPAKNAPIGQEEEPAALGYQLRKATTVNRPVHFMNGEKKEVSRAHIERFNDHMAAHKTTLDKAAFQKRAHKSHAEFVKAVSEPLPNSKAGQSEIVKYK